jgi:hypothetical protein
LDIGGSFIAVAYFPHHHVPINDKQLSQGPQNKARKYAAY